MYVLIGLVVSSVSFTSSTIFFTIPEPIRAELATDDITVVIKRNTTSMLMIFRDFLM